MAEQMVGLADAVQALRAELTTAMAEGPAESLRFELGPVEMEFLLEVHPERGSKAGLRLGVVSGSVSPGSTHRVTLSLTPKGDPGGPRRADTPPRDIGEFGG